MPFINTSRDIICMLHTCNQWCSKKCNRYNLEKNLNHLVSGITRNVPDALELICNLCQFWTPFSIIPYLCVYSQNTSKSSQRMHSPIPTVIICGSGQTCVIRLRLWNKPYSKWRYWMYCVHTAHPHRKKQPCTEGRLWKQIIECCSHLLKGSPNKKPVGEMKLCGKHKFIILADKCCFSQLNTTLMILGGPMQ